MRTDDTGPQDGHSQASRALEEPGRPRHPLEANSNLIMIAFMIGSAALLALVSLWVLGRFSPQTLEFGLGLRSPPTSTPAPSPTPTAQATPTATQAQLPIAVPSPGPPTHGTGRAPTRSPSPGRSTSAMTIVDLALPPTDPAPAPSARPSVTPTAPTVPGAPITVTATGSDATAGVNWTAPADGGSTITGYTITPYLGTTAQTPALVTGDPPATSATVTGLTNGATYTFTVTATNAIGTGPPSTQSNAVTPSAGTVPGAPTNVTAAAGNRSATITWTAPSDGGSTITGYTITPYLGTTAQTPTVITGDPPATSATVTGLRNSTTYTFTVTATNAIGTGPPSTRSNPVKPPH